MAATTTLPLSHFKDTDAAPLARMREQSHKVLASTLKSEGLSAEAKDAITYLLAAQLSEQGGSAPKKPDDDDDEDPSSKTTIGAVADVVGALPPVLIKRAVITLAAALALVQPLVSNFAQSYFGAETQLVEKLDAIIVNQAEDRAADVKRDRNAATISAFVVASETARRAGSAPPPIPAMLTLMAAQNEVERTSGN